MMSVLTGGIVLVYAVTDATAQQDQFGTEEREDTSRYFTFANLLVNGNFELDADRDGFPDDWTAWKWSPSEGEKLKNAVYEYLGTSPEAIVDPGISELFPFYGEKSLLLTSVDGKTGPGVYTLAEFSPGIYTVSLYAKNPGEGTRRLGLFMANGGKLFEVGSRWRNIVHTERVPFKIRQGEVSIRDWTFTPGELLVDRVFLLKLPFDLDYPSRIDLCEGNKTFAIDFTRVDDIKLPIGVNVEIETPSGELVRKNIEGILEHPSDHIEFELSTREKGLYRITLEIYDLRTADIVFTDGNIEALYNTPDSSGGLEPAVEEGDFLDFFPIGIRVQGHEIGDLKGMGFNSVLISNPEVEQMAEQVDILSSMHLRLFYEVSHETFSDSCGGRLAGIIDSGRSMAGFSGWFVRGGFTPETEASNGVADILNCLSHLDHGRPVVMEDYLPDRRAGDEISGVSLVALDPDPVSEPSRPLYVIGLWADYLAADHNRKIQSFGMPQIFGGWPVASRCPTITEVRAMTYVAVNHGARGIIYRDFSSIRPFFDRIDPAWDVRKVAILWNGIPRLNHELRTLSPYFMVGRSGETAIEVEKNEAIDYMTWRDNESILLVAVNVYDGEVDGEFSVKSGDVEATAKVLFEGRGVDVEDGSFSDHFNPYERHVYQFSRLAN